ncbi:MAG: hypothetical protein LBM78_00170 [Clostridiales bacterium]|jgi:hypothetical protein|nr:hypothetical protein [Clostridiales bacterium]
MLTIVMVLTVVTAAACNGTANPQKAIDGLVRGVNKNDIGMILDACVPTRKNYFAQSNSVSVFWYESFEGLRGDADGLFAYQITDYSLTDVQKDGKIACGRLRVSFSVKEKQTGGATVTTEHKDEDFGEVYFVKVNGRWYADPAILHELIR